MRPLMVGGTVGAVLGMALFTQITVHGSFVSHVLPAQILMSVGLGLAFVALSSTALVGVDDHDAGQTGQGVVHGCTVAFTWGLGALILAAILSLVLVTKQRPPAVAEGDETPFEHAEELAHL